MQQEPLEGRCNRDPVLGFFGSLQVSQKLDLEFTKTAVKQLRELALTDTADATWEAKCDLRQGLATRL